MTIQYKFPHIIKSVSERSRIIRSFKRGDEIITEHESLGWFIELDSGFSYGIGMEKPEWTAGMQIDLILRAKTTA